MLLETDLPDDPDTLRAMIVEARAELAARDARIFDRDTRIAEREAQIIDLKTAGAEAEAEIARLTAIITVFQRHRFGARSEKLDDDQMELALEELDAAISRVKAGLDAAHERTGTPRPRKANRGSLPAHLERVEQIVNVESKSCACCGGNLHVIGGYRRAPRCRADQLPCRRDATAALWVSRVRGCPGPGASAIAHRRRRAADRSIGRPCARR